MGAGPTYRPPDIDRDNGGRHVAMEALTPETGLHHPYVEGVRILNGRGGRTYRLCSACAKPANAPRHRMGAAAAKAPKAKDRALGHEYRAGPGVMADKRGRRHGLCADCGKPANAPYHRRGWRGLAPLPKPAPRTRAARGAPSPRASAGVRAGRSLPAAELVMVAVAVDRALALPADALGWRLRMRLADIRPLLGVPTYPTLAAPDHEPDEDAPGADLVEHRPELRPKTLPLADDARIVGLLRGIQSGKNRELVKRARDQGWDVAMTGSGHIALSKGQSRILVSTTQREGRGRGWANLRADARRAGIDVTGL